VVDQKQREILREFYRQLALDPMSLAIPGNVPLSPGESTQLLSGYRGSAKSTELRRLKQYLENDRYAVVLVDIEDEAKVNALDGALRVGSTEIEESDRDGRE
jgi:hypothetical protein